MFGGVYRLRSDISVFREQLTLRETNRTTKIYYVPADKGDDTEIPILTNDAYSISGNNRDGFIITTISEHPKH